MMQSGQIAWTALVPFTGFSMTGLDLNKFLPFVILPLGFSVWMLVAALRWPRRILIVMPLLVLWLLGTPVTADKLMWSLEDRFPYRPMADCPKSDAVFVFGGMLGHRGHKDGGIPWNEAAERFDEAVRLVKAGRAGLLVLSGGPELYAGGPDEGEFLRNEAVERGVPEEQIVVTPTTMNTEAEAKDLCQLVISKHWKQVLIVTSAYHMPRAMRLTRNCRAERIPVPVAYQTSEPGMSWAYRRPEYYLPQAEALRISERAIREYVGMMFYAALGLN
jgi:uncharacterized SAM-binding protein YcdF (DUF218 family)